MEELQRGRLTVSRGIVRCGPIRVVSVNYFGIQIGTSLGRELPYVALSLCLTAPLRYVEFPNTARPHGPPERITTRLLLRERPGLEVLLEGRHVAKHGSGFHRNGWRLPPRGGDGGGSRSRHARDGFLRRFRLLVLFMMLLVPDLVLT